MTIRVLDQTEKVSILFTSAYHLVVLLCFSDRQSPVDFIATSY